MSLPISVLTTNSTPSARANHTALNNTLVQLHGWNPVSQQSADTVGTFIDGYGMACFVQLSARTSPAGPEPTTATRRPVRFAGGSGTTQPSSKPLSMIACSIDFIVTGSPIKPTVQEPSQGAGHTRPVNSGSCLFCGGAPRLSPQAPVYKIVPFRNQIMNRAPEVPPSISIPVWQYGVPQSMRVLPGSGALLLLNVYETLPSL